MTHLIKMAIAITLIVLIFLMQGCFTININIDQGKSLITAPVEYEEEEVPTEEVYVNHKKYI